MRFEDNKRAYTLAEIMLVILILSIIFAAFAPIFTKRRLHKFSGRHTVWSYADTITLDAYTDPGAKEHSGQMFFGLTPNSEATIGSALLPYSKLVIRAGDVTSSKKAQKHIQFRYGRANSTDAGQFAGTWFVNRKNIFLGGGYPNLHADPATGAMENVGIGFEALEYLENGIGNTGIGVHSIPYGTTSHNTAIGYQAGARTITDNGVYIGYEAGRNYQGGKSVFIGYGAGYGKGTGTGTNNLYVGTNAGRSSTSNGNISGDQGNTAIGYNALTNVTNGYKNVAIGYKALNSLTTGHHNIAIGYQACQYVTTGSYKTCIGKNSGPRIEQSETSFIKAREDDIERTYIGSKPYNFPGDAVLEIHNPRNANSNMVKGTGSQVTTNATTIVNGNLIVRGRTYFTDAGKLKHFYDSRKETPLVTGTLKDENDPKNNFNPGVKYNMRYFGYTTRGANQSATCATDLQAYKFGSTKCPNLFYTSDRRLKNISSKSNIGLDEINKLKVYDYTFKNDVNKLPQVGVIAQELGKVFDHSVFKAQDGYLRIRWDEMFFATINAIKELDKKVVALVNRATKVETQISTLEQENTILKSQVEALDARIQKLKAQ